VPRAEAAGQLLKDGLSVGRHHAARRQRQQAHAGEGQERVRQQALAGHQLGQQLAQQQLPGLGGVDVHQALQDPANKGG
jgi:hypothetical protein